MTHPPIVDRRRLLAAGAATGFLASCSGGLLGPSQPPLQIYVLRPQFQRMAGSASPPVLWQLAVALPDAPQSLQTQRIALVRGGTLDYFADAQWTDATPRLLQSLLVQAFETSARITGVAPESEGLHADYIVETEIRNFEAQYADDGPPNVVVSINARLLAADGHVLGTLLVSHEAQAVQNALPAIIEAFAKATGDCFNAIAPWALQTPPPRRK